VSGILDGYRVLDFGRFIAGPYCGALLGDLGADVIRIERVDGGEDRFLAPVDESGVGSAYLQMNRNKRGMTLNPTKPEGRAIVEKLVATADVVLANLPPPTRKSWGLDYDNLKRIKPDIVLTTVSAYGVGGPYQDKVGFDGIGQAMSGNLHLTGPADHPIKNWVPYVDFGTASLTAFATVAALLHREKTGEGQEVQGALLGTALTMNNSSLIEQALINVNRIGSVNRAQTSGPADVFQTKDGWILIQAIGRPMFERIAKMIGEEGWLSDPRFETDLDRGNNGEILSERVAAWCAERTSQQAIAELEEAKIPSGEVYSPQRALDDPHIREVGFMQDVDYPGLAKPAPVATTPVRFTGTPGEIRHRAPTLGEHTDTIMTELGYDADEIAALKEKRIV